MTFMWHRVLGFLRRESVANKLVVGASQWNERSTIKAEIEKSGLFDAIFYVANHPGIDVKNALDHFVDVGLIEGHQPSERFEPATYILRNPDVGACGLPAFLHYIRHGSSDDRTGTERDYLKSEILSSGFFDADFYSKSHSDVDRENALDHFLDVGMLAGHQPSSKFEPDTYLRYNPDVDSVGEIPFLHYIRHGLSEGRRGSSKRAEWKREITSSGLFDPEYYAMHNPKSLHHDGDVLDHYMDVGAAADFRPSLEFDVKGYLELHPDVAKAGVNALYHYIHEGKREGRPLPRVQFNLPSFKLAHAKILKSGLFNHSYYIDQTPTVHDGVDPICHYLLDGARLHLEVSPDFSLKAYILEHPDLLEVGANPLLHHLAHPAANPLPRDLATLRAPWQPGQRRMAHAEETLERLNSIAYFGRFGFTFQQSGPMSHAPEAIVELIRRRPLLTITDHQPDVSIVIPVYGQLPFVLSCLDSLSRHESRFSVEIIVSDDVSPQIHQTESLRDIPWIRYDRRSSNGGFLVNCNGAALTARGKYLVLLNSDTRVVRGWLDELIGSFALFPKAGFIGSKLVNTDGSLQEAGGVYWSDGTAWNYGRNQASGDPRFNFARQVDWVSGASIAVPLLVWREFGGFDEAYKPAYCEDIELAFRIRERGYEVWYQPLSCALHFEGMTHGRDETSGIKTYQVTNLQRLRQSWRGRLPGTRPGGHEPQFEANRSANKRMLVIDANVHMPDRDAGSVVASQIMKAYRELGYQQTLVPLDGFPYQHHYTKAYQREGVEVVYAPFYSCIEDVIKEHRDYDYILVFRYDVARRVVSALRTAFPLARLIFSNVDLHFLRIGREALLKDSRSLKILASRTETDELAVFPQMDCNIVHTPVEAAIVNARLPAPVENFITFPWVSQVVRDTPTLDTRRDIVFLGGFPHTPNVDAVVYFMEKVWPGLLRSLPGDARFLIVGNAPPHEIETYSSDRVVVTGYVPEVEPYLAQARVFVAPLRYGAGIKGKIIQSLANGVPTVASSVAVEGIPVEPGRHYLHADDPESIIAAVLRLYHESELWNALRSAGLDFIEENYSWPTAMTLCRKSLDLADQTWLSREARERTAKLVQLSGMKRRRRRLEASRMRDSLEQRQGDA